jgi:hypothetical protein
MDEYDVIGRWTLQLLLGVVLDAHLGRRGTWGLDRLRLLLVTRESAVTLLGRLSNIIVVAVTCVGVLALGDLRLDGGRGYIGRIDTSCFGTFNLFSLLDELRPLPLGHDTILGRPTRTLSFLDYMADKACGEVVLPSHLLGNQTLDLPSLNLSLERFSQERRAVGWSALGWFGLLLDGDLLGRRFRRGLLLDRCLSCRLDW